MLYAGWMDGMVMIGHRSSKSTFGANYSIITLSSGMLLFYSKFFLVEIYLRI